MALFGVSYGNGNDGLSRLFPSFTIECDPAAIWDVARLAMVEAGGASRAYMRKHVEVVEAGEDAVQACVLNPPRQPYWSEANGAWCLVEVYPIETRCEAPHFMSLKDAFGRAALALSR